MYKTQKGITITEEEVHDLEIKVARIEEHLKSQDEKEIDNNRDLKEYFNIKIEAIEKARSLALIAMKRRLEGMNGFCDALRDQTSCFLTKE